jgi:hypothetical protein
LVGRSVGFDSLIFVVCVSKLYFYGFWWFDLIGYEFGWVIVYEASLEVFFEVHVLFLRVTPVPKLA